MNDKADKVVDSSLRCMLGAMEGLVQLQRLS